MILPIGLCECEIWSLTLSNEDKFRTFDNKQLRTIYGITQEKRETKI